MTQEAQSALRRIMETYSKITRFCLVCNYVTRFVSSLDLAFQLDRARADFLLSLSSPHRIIEPLASRCSKFRFRALDIGSTEERLRMIADSENVLRDDGVSSFLLFLLRPSRLSDSQAELAKNLDLLAADPGGLSTSTAALPLHSCSTLILLPSQTPRRVLVPSRFISFPGHRAPYQTLPRRSPSIYHPPPIRVASTRSRRPSNVDLEGFR